MVVRTGRKTTKHYLALRDTLGQTNVIGIHSDLQGTQRSHINYRKIHCFDHPLVNKIKCYSSIHEQGFLTCHNEVQIV